MQEGIGKPGRHRVRCGEGQMAVERYIAAASLGLFVMFAGEIITVYNFMIDPATEMFEPEPKLLQFISIGAAPAGIMAAVAYIMARQYGSKPIGMMIVAGGVAMMAGMAYTNTLVDSIQDEFRLDSVVMLPSIFMILGIPVIITGALLFRIKKRRVKKGYL